MDQLKADINAHWAEHSASMLADLEKAALTEKQIEEIRVAFNVLDTDHSNSIDYNELKAAMRALGFEVTKAELRNMITVVDYNGSGQIEFPEFVCIFTSTVWDGVEFRKAFYDNFTGKIGFAEGTCIQDE